ncbi:hypothetical protein HaLaN_10427 [Haematococcus lacustris]|uniref:Uncharacterized protein n=1 Tax=Haematococcus lacustris TaxID=44745 RepID=A0A699YYS4_HAELA|nr:hypothetical protein HaLaN_10427 [Haematococcus lacustris]
MLLSKGSGWAGEGWARREGPGVFGQVIRNQLCKEVLKGYSLRNSSPRRPSLGAAAGSRSAVGSKSAAHDEAADPELTEQPGHVVQAEEADPVAADQAVAPEHGARKAAKKTRKQAVHQAASELVAEQELPQRVWPPASPHSPHAAARTPHRQQPQSLGPVLPFHPSAGSAPRPSRQVSLPSPPMAKDRPRARLPKPSQHHSQAGW